MRSNKTALALFDIRDNGKYAQDFVAGLSLDDFKTDRMRFYAVTRAIEIVSEAARHARHWADGKCIFRALRSAMT